MNRSITAFFVALSLAFGGFSLAHDHKKTASEQPMVDGEVKKVDKDAGKVTIKHAPIPSLDMPAMTMVFRVKEPAMLDKVKEGDKIKFSVEKSGGAFTLIKVEHSH